MLWKAPEALEPSSGRLCGVRESDSATHNRTRMMVVVKPNRATPHYIHQQTHSSCCDAVTGAQIPFEGIMQGLCHCEGL